MSIKVKHELNIRLVRLRLRVRPQWPISIN